MVETRWYHDPRLMVAAREKYGSFEAMAEALGGADYTTLSRWWHKHNLGVLPKGPKPKAANESAISELHKYVYG
jgi:hypothetical protein